MRSIQSSFLRLAVAACIFLAAWSQSTQASYIGDTISVNGVPGSIQSTAIIQPLGLEIDQPAATSPVFTCAATILGSSTCGFVALEEHHFSIDLVENGASGLRMDVTIRGTYGAAVTQPQ